MHNKRPLQQITMWHITKQTSIIYLIEVLGTGRLKKLSKYGKQNSGELPHRSLLTSALETTRSGNFCTRLLSAVIQQEPLLAHTGTIKILHRQTFYIHSLI